MKILAYFSVYSDKHKNSKKTLVSMMDATSKYNADLTYIFRYKYSILENDFLDLNKEFIYQNKCFLKKSSLEDISDAQNFIGVSFNILRHISSVSKQTNNLPDDDFLTKVVFAWKDIYERLKPDVFFSGLIDDYVGNIGILVANSMGIPVLTITGGGVQQSVKVGDINYINISKKLSKSDIKNYYEKAYSEWNDILVRDKSVIKINSWSYDFFNLNNILKLFSLLPNSLRTYYFEIPKIERKLWLSPFCLAKRQIKYFISKNFSKFFYKKVPKNEFVLFPLNFLNDALIFTLIPKLDIISEIKKIRMALPTDVTLCVKPHPHWENADLSIREIIEISKIKGVVMVSPHENTRELIKKSKLVIVLNSSVAYDCMFLNKPVLTIGNIFPDEIYELKNYKELPQILKNSSNYVNVEINKKIIAELYANSIIYRDELLYTKGGIDKFVSEKVVEDLIIKYNLIKNKEIKMKWPKII